MTLDDPIVCLPISVRAKNCLTRRAGFKTVRDIIGIHSGELLGIRWFGEHSLSMLTEALKPYRTIQEPPPVERRCGRCWWYDDTDGDEGFCRRCPPVIADNCAKRWPTVNNDDWCGEFKPKNKS